jgi:hypothetical protein
VLRRKRTRSFITRCGRRRCTKQTAAADILPNLLERLVAGCSMMDRSVAPPSAAEVANPEGRTWPEKERASYLGRRCSNSSLPLW